MARHHWRVAEFESAERLRDAVVRLRERGAHVVDTCTPYEVPGLSALMGGRRSPIPVFGFVGGLMGAVVGYAIQWYVDARSYPLNIGGRPNDAIPPYVFVTFETLVLCAALAIFFGLLFRLGLPRYYHPLWEIDGFDRVSSDRFFVVIEQSADRDPFIDLEPLRVVDLQVES